MSPPLTFRDPSPVLLDREPVLLGLLPAASVGSAPSWAPFLCPHPVPCHGGGHQPALYCGTRHERRDGHRIGHHLDVRPDVLHHRLHDLLLLLVLVREVLVLQLPVQEEEEEGRRKRKGKWLFVLRLERSARVPLDP